MTTPNAETARRTKLTDDLLAAALRSRATGARTSHELVASVIGGLDAVPQARRWSWVFPERRILSLVLVGLVTIGLVGMASFAGRPLPTPRPDPGVIAYVGATFGWNGELTVESHAIFAVSSDGGEPAHLVDVPGEPRRLTIGLPTEHDVRVGPAVRWSPDGTQIAFRLYTDAPGIYVMNRDGSGLRLLLAESPSAWDPSIDESNSSFAWSPDGDKIAFISPSRPAPSQPYTTFSGRLYVINVDDGSPRNAPREVAPGASGSIAWSEDGSRIAFGRSHATSSGVVVANADGSGERALIDTEQAWFHVGPIAWSPNGSKIAFMQHRIHAPEFGDVLNVINADGSSLRQVGGPWPNGCCFHGAFGGVLEWSADGTLITTVEGQRIVVVAADGSGEQLSLSGIHFAWSPDGSQLVYSTSGPVIPGSDPPHRSSGIYVVNIDGTGQRWLADGDYPAWSPRTPAY